MGFSFPRIERTERDLDGEGSVTVTACRVLVAEDNSNMLRLITRAMRQRGYDVLPAHSGLELMHWIRMLAEWREPVPLFDMIVTDLRMPVFSGQDCLERLQRLGKNVPVILITAFGDPQVHRDAKAAGARAVMDKPLDLGELCSVVDRELR